MPERYGPANRLHEHVCFFWLFTIVCMLWPVTEVQAEDKNTSDALLGEPLQPVLQPYRDAQGWLRDELNIDFHVDVLLIYQALTQTVDDGNPMLLSDRYNINFAWTAFDDPNFGKGRLVFQGRGGYNIGADDTLRLDNSAGSLFYLNAAQFTIPIVVRRLWWEQTFYTDSGREFVKINAGYVDPTLTFDLNRIANDESATFLSGPLDDNSTVALPAPGLGANVTVRPTRWLYLAAGVNDSGSTAGNMPQNISIENTFWIGEFGFPVDIENVGPGTYRFYGWWSRLANGVPTPVEGEGFGISIDQQVGEHFVPFMRYGIASGDFARFEQYVSVGTALIKPFGRKNDMFGVGVNWGSPTDDSLRDEWLIETFYRLQLTELLQISPDLQIMPQTSNPDVDGPVFVLGVRLKATF